MFPDAATAKILSPYYLNHPLLYESCMCQATSTTTGHSTQRLHGLREDSAPYRVPVLCRLPSQAEEMSDIPLHVAPFNNYEYSTSFLSWHGTRARSLNTQQQRPFFKLIVLRVLPDSGDDIVETDHAETAGCCTQQIR